MMRSINTPLTGMYCMDFTQVSNEFSSAIQVMTNKANRHLS